MRANKWAKDHSDLVEFERGLQQHKQKGEEDAAMEAKVQKKTARRARTRTEEGIRSGGAGARRGKTQPARRCQYDFYFILEVCGFRMSLAFLTFFF